MDGHVIGLENTDVNTHEGPILAAGIYSLFGKFPQIQGIEATATTTITIYDPGGPGLATHRKPQLLVSRVRLPSSTWEDQVGAGISVMVGGTKGDRAKTR